MAAACWRTPVEAVVAAAWQEALRQPRVGVDDNFFAAGGHSLLAARVTARLRAALGLQLPHTLLFENQTIAEIAAAIERMGDSLPAAEPPRRRPDGAGPPPLSFAQERVWFLEQLAAGSAYTVHVRIWLRGRLDPPALERALQRVVDRHESLRTSFPERGGAPVQQVHEPWAVALPVVDLTDLPGPDRDPAMRSLVDRAIRRPFDTAAIPLARWTLYRLAPDEHVLLHSEHHFVHDGWSFNLFLGELFEAYRAELAGTDAALPPLPVQFGDFAVWQRAWAAGPEAAAQLAWWRRTLAGIPAALELPTDRPRPAVQTYAGDAVRVRLPARLSDELRALARQESVTLFMTFVAALAALLGRWCRQDDVVLGSALANRRWPETERLIGMMLNTVALRVDLSGDPTARQLLGRVRETTLGACRHQDVPFERVVEEVRPERTLSRNPLFQVMCGFHDAPPADLDPPGLRVELEVALSNGSAKFDLSVTVIPRAEQGRRDAAEREITVICEYNRDLFDRATVERLVACYERVLAGLAAAPDRPVADIDLLDPDQRRAQAGEWNRTAVAWDGGGLLDEFAARVRETPAAVAVRCGDRRLTYAELAALAARAADRLRAAGLAPEARVGVCVERSPELVAALLGVMAAGAAYVPLDPGYPQERLEHMIADAGLGAVVTQRSLRDRLPVPDGVPVLDVAALAAEAGGPRDLPAAPALDRLAYVIYTSGSTGRPKGVAISRARSPRSRSTSRRWSCSCP
ncbi:MAG: hypothetical protein E6J41_09740 [Chloroflexi bacterium]|nr:MAG: hypothetical protein E6J41_09740 [Chloroflexota bacterium]